MREEYNHFCIKVAEHKSFSDPMDYPLILLLYHFPYLNTTLSLFHILFFLLQR